MFLVKWSIIGERNSSPKTEFGLYEYLIIILIKNKTHYNPFVFKCNYKLSPKIFRMAWQRQWLTTVSRNIVLSLKNKVVQSKHRNKDLNLNLLLSDHKTQENMLWRRKNKITESNPNKYYGVFLMQTSNPKI